jgi:hypothetical protein
MSPDCLVLLLRNSRDLRLCSSIRIVLNVARWESNGWTRLLARGSGYPVGHVAFDIPHFVMEQKMLRGIRRRAEQTRRAAILSMAYGPSHADRAA